MKRIITFFAAALSVSVCFAQSKAEYLEKAKRQKTAAWVCLGAGFGVSVIGLTQINVAGSDNGKVNNTPGTILLAAGVAAEIISIPLFVAASKNKKKAISMAFHKINTATLGTNGFVSNTKIPAITLQIKL